MADEVKTVQRQEPEQKLTKQQQKAIRSYKHRFLKNLLIWFVGVISCIPLLCGAIFGALYFIPLSTFMGNDSDLVSDRVADKTILSIVLNIDEYSMADLPVIGKTLEDAIEKNGLDKFITVDMDKINQLQFKYNDGRTLPEELKKCITVSATLNSVGATEMLGDLAKLEMFTEWKPVDYPSTTQEGFNYKLYYYKSGDKYLPAYKEVSGEYVFLGGEEEQLYMANLSEVPLLDAFDLMDESFSGLTLKNLFETFGAGTIDDNSLIGKVIGDKTLADANDIGKDLLLSDLIEITNDTQELYDLICDSLVIPDGQPRPTRETVSIQHLIDYPLTIDNIDLESVLPKKDVHGKPINTEIYKILEGAVKDENKDGKIQVGELESLEVGNIVLSTVIPHDKTNQELYRVLEDLYGDSVDNVTLNDLHDFNTDNLHLGAALPRATHESLYEVLESAITLPAGISDVADIKLGELDNYFHSEDIKLQHITGDNDALKKIIDDAYRSLGKTYETVTLGDLTSFNINGVKLASVLDGKTGNDILDALVERGVTLGEIGDEINSLTLYEVYGVECFTTTPVANSPRYNKSIVGGKVVYTYSETGEYYVAEHSGIWLLLCFDGENFDDTGRPLKYVQSSASILDLQDNSDVLSQRFTSATIRQLVDAGIITNTNPTIMSYTLQRVVDELGKIL